MEKINTEQLILASQSPRRKQLLEEIGIKVKIVPPNIDESVFNDLNPDSLVRKLSFKKAENVAVAYPHQ